MQAAHTKHRRSVRQVRRSTDRRGRAVRVMAYRDGNGHQQSETDSRRSSNQLCNSEGQLPQLFNLPLQTNQARTTAAQSVTYPGEQHRSTGATARTLAPQHNERPEG